VVAAVRDPNPRHHGKGLAALCKRGIRADVGACRDEASRLIEPFGKRIVTGYPFVTLKLACSLDGRIADRRGKSRWISGPAARRWVRGLRRRVDAVLVGAGTARADDPGLLAFDRGVPRNYRVLVSSDGNLPRSLRAISDRNAGHTIVAVSRDCQPHAARKLAAGGASVWSLPSTRSGRVSLRALMRRLAESGFMHVLCEGGGELAAALVKAGLVDSYRFVLAGRLLGGRGTAAVGGEGWPLAAAPRLRVVSVERLGQDVLLTAVPARTGARRGKGKEPSRTCSPG
jgi:diaminohydroxyphosphoribosylaminopyrimidine deaminase/5-amino-6-(5-phosphoribosylamino)uracil reductase